MNIKELNKRKTPIVKIDKSLNKYDDTVLFPDKLTKANKMLRTVGLPKLPSKNIPKRRAKRSGRALKKM